MIRNIMLKLIEMKKAIKFFMTMYALTVVYACICVYASMYVCVL